MSHRAELVGRRFGRLVVLGEAADTVRLAWSCRCDCGNDVLATTTSLTTGEKKSCGCLHLSHGDCRGDTPSKEYSAWISIKQHCYNPSSHAYYRYGGRGITVCREWRNSFQEFLAYMGRAPSPRHSIDRIDSNGNYQPGNCRWATAKEQGSNRTNSVLLEHGGERITITEAARRFGFTYNELEQRLERTDWNLEEAVKITKRKYTFRLRKPAAPMYRSGTPEYNAWISMRFRCNSPKSKAYCDYGAVGIRVCARWDSFDVFLTDMGRRPSADHSLDRIDSTGDYKPTNCRWATKWQQAQNRKSDKLWTFRGESLTLSEWSKRLGISRIRLRSRLKNDWTISRAFSTPPLRCDFRAKRYSYKGRSLTLRQWSAIVRIQVGTIEYRIKSGWPIALALSSPVNKGKRPNGNGKKSAA